MSSGKFMKGNYQLCLKWLTHSFNIVIFSMKLLLRNKLNDFCLETLAFKYFLFRVCFNLNERSEIFH